MHYCQEVFVVSIAFGDKSPPDECFQFVNNAENYAASFTGKYHGSTATVYVKNLFCDPLAVSRFTRGVKL